MCDRDIVYRELKSIVGSDRVTDDEAILATYAMDSATPLGRAGYPSFVVLPMTTDEVKGVLEVANRYKIPVVPMSRGANIASMSIPSRGGIILDLRLMDNIIEINTDAAYALIEPGVTFHKLAYEVKKYGFICQLPTASGGASPLANYLMRPSGNLTAMWDPDPIIALEVVTPTGYILRTGSASFGINSWRARYGPFPDLTGLFCCSYGTLGVVTKAAVKIFDRGEEERLFLAAFDNFRAAVEFMKIAIRRKLIDSVTFWNWGWCMFHDMILSKERELPPEMLKPDQRTPPPGHPYGIASARISGYTEVVDAQERVCKKLVEQLGGRVVSAEEAREKYPGSWAYWNAYYIEGVHIKPGEESQLRAGLHLPGCLIAAEPSKVVEVEERMWRIAEKEFKPPVFYRSLPYSHAREFFLAFVVYATGPMVEEQPYLAHLRRVYARLYDELLRDYGAIMFRFRRDPMYVIKTGIYAEVLRQIKHIFDPNNIMNPGIMMF